jgi:hypothetical protein
MTQLVGGEFVAWLGLRRVHRGGRAKLGAPYLDNGLPVPGFLVPDVAQALRPAALRPAAPRPAEPRQGAPHGDEDRRG